jgi:hypothetical protein
MILIKKQNTNIMEVITIETEAFLRLIRAMNLLPFWRIKIAW